VDSRSVVIVDYKLGNLFSVVNACKTVGLEPIVSSSHQDLESAQAVILPGVGAFGDAMRQLQTLDLISPLRDFVERGKFLFGICLGMQLLCSSSEEFGSHEGLSFIPGTVKRFPATIADQKVKIPHIGWNQLTRPSGARWEGTPLAGLDDNDFMYFVHSYYVCPTEESDILTSTNYSGREFCSSVRRGNVFATQFHPEKSGVKGRMLYQTWKDLAFAESQTDR